VVIQNDLFNRSAMATVIVCALTSNLGRRAWPGNVMLDRAEANLPRRSVVNVSQVFTVDKAALVKRIGNVSPGRLRQILDGVKLLTEPRDVD
jgi:mRNA interferase MazF